MFTGSVGVVLIGAAFASIVVRNRRAGAPRWRHALNRVG